MKSVLLHTCCAPCLIHPYHVFRERGFEVTAYFYNPNIHPYGEYQKRLDAFVEYCDKNAIGYEIGDYDVECYMFEIAPTAFVLSKGGTAAEFYQFFWKEDALVNYSFRLGGGALASRSAKLTRINSMLEPGSAWRVDLTKDEGGFWDSRNKARRRRPEHANQRCAICYRIRLKETARRARDLGIGLFSTTLLASPYQDASLIKSAGADSAIEHGVLFIGDDLSAGYSRSVEESKKLGLYRQKYCGCVFSEKEKYYKPGRY